MLLESAVFTVITVIWTLPGGKGVLSQVGEAIHAEQAMIATERSGGGSAEGSAVRGGYGRDDE